MRRGPRRAKRGGISPWLLFGALVLAVALPQLLFYRASRPAHAAPPSPPPSPSSSRRVAPAADAPARPRVVAWAVTVTKDGPVADGAAVSAARRPFP